MYKVEFNVSFRTHYRKPVVGRLALEIGQEVSPTTTTPSSLRDASGNPVAGRTRE